MREQVASPLHPALWTNYGPAPGDAAFAEASPHFRGPRFQALARQWEQDGERAVLAALSATVLDAFETGRRRLECVELTQQYPHLTGVVGVASKG